MAMTIDELNKKYGWNGTKEELIEALKANKYPIKYTDDILSYGWEIYAVCGHLSMEHITQGKARDLIFAILQRVSDGIKYTSEKEVLPLCGVVFSETDKLKRIGTFCEKCREVVCKCEETSEAEVCPLCNNTCEYHFGGSFGGSVQIQKCNCGRT